MISGIMRGWVITSSPTSASHAIWIVEFIKTWIVTIVWIVSVVISLAIRIVKVLVMISKEAWSVSFWIMFSTRRRVLRIAARWMSVVWIWLVSRIVGPLVMRWSFKSGRWSGSVRRCLSRCRWCRRWMTRRTYRLSWSRRMRSRSVIVTSVMVILPPGRA